MKPYFYTAKGKLYHGDCREMMANLPEQSIQCCVTSPPYFGLRDYGHEGQIGLEQTPDEYVQKLVDVFREVWRVLRDDGTVWVNLGDTYAAARSYQVVDNKHKDVGNKIGHKVPPGCKQKDLIGIPWMVAFALRADGWYLRQDIIWSKPNPMPESVKDRCTKSHEYVFLLSKSQRYFYDADAVKEEATNRPPGNKKPTKGGREYDFDERFRYAAGLHKITAASKRNLRSVWTVSTRPYPGAHFATFPPDLIKPCIKAGSQRGAIVLDPFFGSGTTGLVAQKLGRQWIGLELSAEYCEIAKKRIPAGYQMSLMDLVG